jgi:hypothetical protein
MFLSWRLGGPMTKARLLSSDYVPEAKELRPPLLDSFVSGCLRNKVLDITGLWHVLESRFL